MPQLPHIIRQEIAEQGPIPFARFMELALYCPDCGFYEKEEDKVGRGGDFYTSVSVGPLFGELLAYQFSEWLAERGTRNVKRRTKVLQLVEAGAHDGRLALDILNWLKRQRPEVLEAAEYCILEPSVQRREWQKETLAEFGAQVCWVAEWEEYRARTTHHATRFTILFSNELLDAMPVHRFGWDAARRHWFEWGVMAEGVGFAWRRLKLPDPSSMLHLPSSPELLAVLPDGFIFENSPAAEEWWSEASRSLGSGRLLTFDYGYDAAGAIIPERPNGTLRAYRNHRYAADILADPGEQDITAHVNFARIEQAGVATGLKTEAFETQGQFLTKLASSAWKPGSQFCGWDARHTRQFQTLTHPEHLGRSFRVLIQSRNCSS